VRALMRLKALDLRAEQPDRAAIAGQVTGEKVEERGLARAVRADDEPALARHDLERDIVDRGQAAERLLQAADLERGRHLAHQRAFKRAHPRRIPGTRPSGMKITITTKTKPSSMFQRSM